MTNRYITLVLAMLFYFQNFPSIGQETKVLQFGASTQYLLTDGIAYRVKSLDQDSMFHYSSQGIKSFLFTFSPSDVIEDIYNPSYDSVSFLLRNASNYRVYGGKIGEVDQILKGKINSFLSGGRREYDLALKDMDEVTFITSGHSGPSMIISHSSSTGIDTMGTFLTNRWNDEVSSSLHRLPFKINSRGTYIIGSKDTLDNNIHLWKRSDLSFELEELLELPDLDLESTYIINSHFNSDNFGLVMCSQDSLDNWSVYYLRSDGTSDATEFVKLEDCESLISQIPFGVRSFMTSPEMIFFDAREYPTSPSFNRIDLINDMSSILFSAASLPAQSIGIGGVAEDGSRMRMWDRSGSNSITLFQIDHDGLISSQVDFKSRSNIPNSKPSASYYYKGHTYIYHSYLNEIYVLDQEYNVTDILPDVLTEEQSHTYSYIRSLRIKDDKVFMIFSYDFGESNDLLVRDLNTVTASSDYSLLERELVYPNPTPRFLSLQSSYISDIESVVIFGADGHQISLDAMRRTWDLSGISAGIYFLQIRYRNGKYTTLPLIKK